MAPTGGLKDTIPPVMIRSNPTMNSKNFKGDKVTITFNEFIQLKDIQKKLVVSPPMVKAPETLIKGKSVEVRFKEPLKDNTTYTTYFADAIVDNNEGNPIKSFEFVFSTGSSIDSLTATGIITDAFTLKPVEGAMVMLYDKISDSIPYKELPLHISRSSKNGQFVFKNLSYKDFKVFALKDGNANYKFDAVSEDIAFSDSIVRKEVLKGVSRLDTSKASPKNIKLVLFKEDSRVQVFTGFSRDKRRKLSFSFTKKPVGNLSIVPMGVEIKEKWFIEEFNTKEDTLTYWITNDKISSIDSLRMIISYMRTDSLERLQPRQDTLRMNFVDKEKPRSRRDEKKKEDKVYNYYKGDINIKKDQVAKPTIPFEIRFPMPLKKIDYSFINLIYLKDSSKIDFKFENDSLHPRKYYLNFSWKSDMQYKFEALPGAFTAIDGVTVDTISVRFKGANPENFGSLIITLGNVKKSAIVELLDERGERVISTKNAKAGEKVVFSFIDPGKYRLRFIDDRNMNGKWDTGWYLKKIQPEKVYMFDDPKSKGVINIRANWENEINFDFEN